MGTLGLHGKAENTSKDLERPSCRLHPGPGTWKEALSPFHGSQQWLEQTQRSTVAKAMGSGVRWTGRPLPCVSSLPLGSFLQLSKSQVPYL